MSKDNKKPFYYIGIEEIDKQHHNLVDMIDRLAKSINQGLVNEEIGAVLKELVEYTKEHFADEEKLMREMGFVGYPAHKKMHENLTASVVKILTDLKNGQQMDVFDMIAFLKDWLINHITNEDIKIGKAHNALVHK